MNTDKQIADTIIQQQKKLLDHIQSKYSIDLGYLTTNNAHNSGSSHHSGSSSHNHLTSKFFKRNNKNPLLANLTKPSESKLASKPITAAQPTLTSSSRSTPAKAKSTAMSIQAELNSNYMAYSELNKQYKPPSMVPPPPTTALPAPNNVASSSLAPASTKPLQIKSEPNKNIHVFITGLNTFPVYCHVVNGF